MCSDDRVEDARQRVLRSLDALKEQLLKDTEKAFREGKPAPVLCMLVTGDGNH